MYSMRSRNFQKADCVKPLRILSRLVQSECTTFKTHEKKIRRQVNSNILRQKDIKKEKKRSRKRKGKFNNNVLYINQEDKIKE
jgi:hypothetical protein